MSTVSRNIDEARLAAEIVAVLPEGVVRLCSDDRDAIRYTIRASGLKLRSVVLRRAALRKLLTDPARSVKVDYLRRDLERSAMHLAEFRYPRPRVVALGATQAVRQPADEALPCASAF